MSLQVTRHNLPHWELENYLYFITWHLHQSQNLLNAQERTVVKNALFHFNGSRYIIYAYVVMTDHVHVLHSLLSENRLAKVVHTWKSYTANVLQRNLNRTGSIWERDYYNRIIRDEKDYLEKANYIITNPERKWENIEDYEWVGFKDN